MTDTISRAVAVLEAQTAKGVRKYGGTLDQTRPSGPELVDHAIQEAADLLLYLVALRNEGGEDGR